MAEWTLLGNFSRGPYDEHLSEINFEFRPAAQMLLKDFSIYSSGGHFVWRSITIWAILVEGFEKHFWSKIV